MKKMINKVSVQGLFYEGNLKLSKQYVNGKLSVLTSAPNSGVTNTCELKVIAGPRYGNKPDAKLNPNYPLYESLMNTGNEKAYLHVGEQAQGVSISGSLGANYFVPRGTDLKRENVRCPLQYDASFITFVDGNLLTPADYKATFETDIVITSIVPEMSKPVGDTPAMETGNIFVKGYIFDYKGVAIEASFIAKATEDGSYGPVDYFTDLSSEFPVFTKIWGVINGFKVVSEKREESAFGAPKIVSFETTKKELVITGALPQPYPEGMITAEEFQESLQQREIAIATALDRQITATTTPVPPNVSSGSTNEFSSMFTGLTPGMSKVL